jgi:predicted deacylase
VHALVNGSVNVMRALKMLPGTAKPVEHPVWLERVITVAAEAPGIFYPTVKRGTYVEKGMQVGYVTDYVGTVIAEAHAPEAGVITFIRAVPSLNTGDTMANVGVVKR